MNTAVEWLLEDDQPSIRYLALKQLMGRAGDDPDVASARGMIPKKGWAADILAKQSDEGWWVGGESLYRPKYLSSNWMLLILSDLGVTKDDDPRVAGAAELWIDRFARPDGGFGSDREFGAVQRPSHYCIVGNTARGLIKLGYVEHPRVKSALEWLANNRAENGGWNCFGKGRNLDSWEAMSAFAEYPKRKWTRGMKAAVEEGAEFYLEKQLHKQGARYPPWYRFHYPFHYYYDLLIGLEFMTALGYGNDKRLNYAISLLKEKRRPDGRWDLDAVHPDVAGYDLKWLKKNPNEVHPFALERPGRPSKMITVRALTVLKRLEG